MSWFETVPANLDMKVNGKVSFTCQEAASAMIAEEWCNVEGQTGVTHGRPNARKVEYCAETADIRVGIHAEIPPPINLLTMKPGIDRAN